MADYTRKKGDRHPLLERDFFVDGVAADCTGSTLTFSMRPVGSLTPTIDRVAATFVTVNPGRGRYTWTAGDALIAAGSYEGEFEETKSDGTKRTFPNDGHLSILILGDLA